MTLPAWLRSPDPDHTPATLEDWLRRAKYAYPSQTAYDSDYRPLKVNYGYGEQVFTLEDCFVWMERRADAELP